MTPGSIVRCRDRHWVLLPEDGTDCHRLRPLAGATDDVVAVDKRLASLMVCAEQLKPASFPLPTTNDVADATGSHLLWQAARLTLRDGATPFRALGRVSLRPRTYQFVPLLMALRLDPVRLLIADDVGVGKTIEALLIARELWDRGEIRRICVLCPPVLCDWWQQELRGKVHLDSVLVRTGTLSQLERGKPAAESIYRHYPIQVASIDFVKTERNRHQFLLDAPEFTIVDEAHGSAPADPNDRDRHQRFELLRELAANKDRHLLLLTATPHSGVEGAFRSLLSLLRPEFAEWDTSTLKENQRIELARHYVQRTRRDIEQGWEEERCFPDRDPSDVTYKLSAPYRELFDAVYDFCTRLVTAGPNDKRRRARYWGALALLRCVMSSPAAALRALETRDATLTGDDDAEPDFRGFVVESAEDATDDDAPMPPVESATATLVDADRRRLRELGKLAAKLNDSTDDSKLTRCTKVIGKLLKDGFMPIVWCRYIATADYVAAGLLKSLGKKYPKLRVVSITGRMDDDERRQKIAELHKHSHRVLVATDCLSEGVNLQDDFSAVLHYDLPWNPNRLEQREGRVDRYGQPNPVVKAIRYYCPESPVDGVVLDVLLNKAREIHRALGTHVPVPEDDATVTQALLNALFLRGKPAPKDGPVQREFDFGDAGVEELHRRWEIDAERERQNRTRFAQRALKPDEVRKELEAVDAVLGDPAAVREFVLAAAQRLGFSILPATEEMVFAINLETKATLPESVRFALPDDGAKKWLVSFHSPTPAGAEYLGRNHPFVEALARFLMEEALTKAGAAHAARCGVIRTKAVARLTTIHLLRVRYLVQQLERHPLLSEEVLVEGRAADWLDRNEALRLLADAKPDANVPKSEKQELIAAALAEWPKLQADLAKRIGARGTELEKSHKRVRQAVGLKVRDLTVAPQLPPDLLGVLVLQPVAGS